MAVEDPAHLFRRDGRLSELTIDRLLLDDLGGAEREAVEAHLARSPDCRAAVEAARGFDATHPLSPPGRVLPFRRRAARVWAPLAGGLALAAALALVLWRGPAGGPPGDGLRVKGGRFELEVHVHDGTRSRRVSSGAPVRPGDRVGFAVESDRPGHLLLLGIDARGETYPCYPQTPDGRAAALAPSVGPRPLPAAVRLDATPGRERLVALFCPEPFSSADVARTLRAARAADPLPVLRPGCTQREVVLVKAAP